METSGGEKKEAANKKRKYAVLRFFIRKVVVPFLQSNLKRIGIWKKKVVKKKRVQLQRIAGAILACNFI